MKEDTLLIGDNYNMPTGQDAFPDTLLTYRCTILFTTHCRYEEQTGLELTELSRSDLLQLMGSFADWPP